MPSNVTDFLIEFLSEERVKRIHDVVNQRTRHLTIVLENITHSHNASACLRTCDCFGVQDVHVVDTFQSFKPNPDVERGASQWLTIHRYGSKAAHADHQSKGYRNLTTAGCIEQLRGRGYRILATSPRQDSIPLHMVDVRSRTAVIFGSEKLGVSQTVLDQADQLVHVPMFGFTESFNVSVSTAIVLQQLRHSMHTISVDWGLSAGEKQELVELWIKRSLGQKLAPLLRRFEADSQKR